MSISPVDLVKRGDNGVASGALFQLKRDVRDDDELLASKTMLDNEKRVIDKKRYLKELSKRARGGPSERDY